MISITIFEKPIPLQRARSGKSGFYDPQFIAKKNFAHCVKEQFKQESFNSQIKLELEFIFEMPVSWSKKKKIEYIGSYHKQTPDTSNLIKFVEDALLGVTWKDDCIISILAAKKTWGTFSQTKIIIHSLNQKEN